MKKLKEYQIIDTNGKVHARFEGTAKGLEEAKAEAIKLGECEWGISNIREVEKTMAGTVCIMESTTNEIDA